MTPINLTNSLRFSGYRLSQPGQARLFLPGYGQSNVQAEAILPGATQPTPVELKRQGDYWVSSKAVPLGTQYRFKVDGQDKLDIQETRRNDHGLFNVVSANEATAPQKSSVIADIFLDSLVTRGKLKQLAEANGGTLPIRNHFNLFGGDERALNEILPALREAGFTALLFKPFIGGDNQSSHRYWTNDPYVLNSSFSSKKAFRDFVNAMLRNDMKLFADGAFVNQGLNGVQYRANLAHGFRSPYWNWFTYDENQNAGQIMYPRHAYEKATIGVLPTVQDPKTGHRDTRFDRVEFVVLNDPEKPVCLPNQVYDPLKHYDPKRPTLIRQYDPNAETADGQPKKAPYSITNSEDSAQRYEFEITPAELKAKREEIARKGLTGDARKAAMAEWGSFRLGPASLDDSGLKWDGQIDVAKMNMKNPEVIAYLGGAMEYWTRFVMNSQVEAVANALTAAKRKNAKASPTQLIKAITLTPTADLKKADKTKVLPPVTLPEAESLSAEEAKDILEGVRPLSGPAAQTLSKTLMREYPLEALELPLEFKAVLSYPGLEKLLTEPTRFGKLLMRLAKPLEWIGLKSLADKLTAGIAPFSVRLGNSLREAMKYLDESRQEKLRYGDIQSLVADALAETVYLRLLTGQTSRDRTQAADGLYKTMPLRILKADPKTAAAFLPGFLKERLASLDPKEIARQLEKQLTNLEPETAALARAIVEKREYGLNWRIDAAKDVGDMDRVRDASPEDRGKLFAEEMAFVQNFWKDLGAAIRKIFPKTTIISELTDFELLSNEQGDHKPISNKAFNDLFEQNVFTSMPNMRYLYSPMHRLIHYGQRPDEYGANSMMKPSEFLKHAIEPMSTAMPFPSVRQYQNMSASHDYANTSHTFMINPQVYVEDHFNWKNLNQYVGTAISELTTMPGLKPQLDTLAAVVPNTKETLKKFQDLLYDEKAVQPLPPEMAPFYSEASRKAANNWTVMPREMKADYIAHVLSLPHVTQTLNLTAEQANALKTVLTERIMEHSEARAMRHVISNTLQQVDWTALMQGLNLKTSDAAKLKAVVIPEFYDAMNAAVKKWGRHFGPQPLDIALDNVMKELGDGWTASLPESARTAETVNRLKQDLKTQLYTIASKPVMEKLQRVFALQVAAPGNPSIYLPDLFAQGGSEWLKNIFVQNRNLIRVDKLAEDTDFQAFFKDAGNILNLRKKYPALTNGTVLTVPVNDDDGVVPIIRDAGPGAGNQVIMLVNTGKPEMRDDKSIVSTQPVKKDFKLDLSSLGLDRQNTRYEDAETGEPFKLNEQGQLVSALNPQQGIDIGIYRCLVRTSE